MKKILLMMIAGSCLFFGSCVKSGPVGPQGPQGNANVLGSDPFTVNSWSQTSDHKSYYASFTNADITSAVADHGVVEVFRYYPSDNTWKNLPDALGGLVYSFQFSQGGFEIYFDDVNGFTAPFPGSQTFRAVAIAPSFKQAHPNTNWKNYNEAMAALNSTATAPSATE